MSELRAVCPDLLALAWTPGTKWSHFRSLEGVGFDGVFSSLPWWDFRSPWLLEEYDALRRIAPVLGCPDALLGSPSVAKSSNQTVSLHYRRSLRFAAAAFDGLLVPIEFRRSFGPHVRLRSTSDKSGADTSLRDDIVAANELQATLSTFDTGGEIRNLSEGGAPVAACGKIRSARRPAGQAGLRNFGQQQSR